MGGLLVLVGLVFFLGMIASGGNLPSRPNLPGVGKPVRGPGKALTVLRVFRSSGDEVTRPNEGYEFLFVQVRIEHLGGNWGPADYHRDGFHLQDSNGNREQVDPRACALLARYNQKVLGSGTLVGGGKVEAWLGFQVPCGDSNPILVWRTGFFRHKEYQVRLATH